MSWGTNDANEPASPISPEEQTLQTLAYEKIAAFNGQEFSGENYEMLPYSIVSLYRFGVTQDSPVLECEVRIQESNGEDTQAFAQKLEILARSWPMDGWVKVLRTPWGSPPPGSPLTCVTLPPVR